ncbi:hypothetical protein QYJ89_003856 [Salmonella enterica]|nr:hypothetical protein [Salmonella enterica]EDH3231997.1 hypothetical protein [Salmonella enterica]ELJ6679611.1 hypothetical protein [Salmonella enterica]
MECNISELVKSGHERAAELKASCCAVDVRSVAQLIRDLASQLEVQLVRSNTLAAENAHARERHVFIRALAVSILEHSGGRMDWRGAMEDATELLQTVDSVYAKTPATDAFLAEVRAQGVEMFSEKFGGGTLLSNMVKEVAADFAAKLRKGVAQ